MTYYRRPIRTPGAMVRRPRRSAARSRGLPSMPDYGDSAYYWFHEALRPATTDTTPRTRALPAPEASRDTEAGAQSTGIGGYLLAVALVILVLVGGGTWLGSALTSTLSTPTSA